MNRGYQEVLGNAFYECLGNGENFFSNVFVILFDFEDVFVVVGEEKFVLDNAVFFKFGF